MDERRLGFIGTLLLSTFLMGSSFIAGKILLQQGFPPLSLVGWRFVVAAIATLPLLALGHEPILRSCAPRGFGWRNYATVVLIGLIQTAAVMGLLFLAMRWISAATAAILLFTNPIWVAALGRLFLGERLSATRLSGLLFGVIGVVLAIGLNRASFASSEALMGDVIGLGSAVCWAIATLIHKRANLPMGAWALSFWQMLIGAVALLAIAGFAGQQWPPHATALQWGWFLWLAIPASTGSFGLWFVPLANAGPANPSAWLFLAPFFAVLLSHIFLDTHLTSVQVVGGMLIAMAIWLESRGRDRVTAPPP